MRAFRDLSIRGKLTLIIMVTSSVASLLACAAFVSHDLYTFRSAKVNDLTTVADIIGSNSTAALTFKDANSAREILAGLSAKKRIVAACIYGRDGQVFAKYLRGNPNGDFSPPAARDDGSRFENNQLVLFRKIVLDGEKIGTVCLQSDLSEVRERLYRYAAVLFLVALGSLLVALLVSSSLQRAISEPIRTLAWTTKMVGVEKNYSIRAVKKSEDELGLLIEGFNEMLGQIERRDTALLRAHNELEKRVEERTEELQQEIGERKRAEEALRESEERIRLLLDSTAEAIYGIDMEGNCTFCNAATLRLLGYQHPNELLGKNMHALIHHTRPDGTPYPSEECRIYQAFRRGEGTHVDDEVLWRADGTSFPVEFWSYPIRRGGEAVGAVMTFVDITERKRAEELLGERTAYLNALIENSPLAIVAHDSQNVVQMCNPAFERLFLYRREEVVGVKLDDLIKTEQKGSEASAVTQRVLGGQTVHLATRRGRRDGTAVDVEVYAVPLIVEGKLVGAYGLYQDITERKRAEERLRLLAHIVENSAELVAMTDLERRVQFANPAMLRAIGYSEEELLGRDIATILSSTNPPDLAAEITAQTLAGGWKGAVLHLRKDGSEFPSFLSTGLIHGDDGQPMALFGIASDITERRRAEEAFRESEEKYRRIVETAYEGICIVDAEAKLKFVNGRMAEMLGYRVEEMLDHSAFDFWDAQSLPKADPALEERRRGIKQQYEVCLRHKNGSAVWVIVSATPIFDADGVFQGSFSMSTDITMRRRAEEELQRAKEAAEAANRAKSDFLANMSHEIRTPMNGILGMTELALDTDLNPEQREYLGMVKTSADSLLRVINDILDFSKIEAGKLDLDQVEFNLRDGLGETLKTLAIRAHKKHLELSYWVQADVPDSLVGDPGRLRQLVVNLVGNAIKFTERGEVVVRVAVESQTSETMRLHFVVSDTGIGISGEEQRLIFEPFAQADGSMTRRHGGTGLGLTISKRLVELMGGRVWVESEPGHGSAFHFTASFGLTETPAPGALPLEAAALENLPTLVVDDNATNRQILEEMLTHWRMAPRAADGGRAALAAMEEACGTGRAFRLVLLDVHMSDLDGFAVAEQIKRNPELAGATIMMLTSDRQRGDAARCQELGIAAYLTKPITQSELLDAILLALGQRPQVSLAVERVASPPPRTAKRLRILLAEDNLVNQGLAVRLLEKRGHMAVVTRNGREALEALEKSSFRGFDAVLMDVQMPEMDGLEATAAIRTWEKVHEGHIPIIAMTAHALKGDRERCLEAGMDGYVSKPIRAAELLEEVERCEPKAPTELPRPMAVPQPASGEVLDRAALLEHMEGDPELLAEMVTLFLQDCPRLLAALREALARGDARALRRAAHTLKGTVSNFAAPAATAAALRLERMGREGDLSQAAEGCAALETEIERLKPLLANLCQEVAR